MNMMKGFKPSIRHDDHSFSLYRFTCLNLKLSVLVCSDPENLSQSMAYVQSQDVDYSRLAITETQILRNLQLSDPNVYIDNERREDVAQRARRRLTCKSPLLLKVELGL